TLAAAGVWPEVARADVTSRSSDFACAALMVVQAAAPFVALLVAARATDPRHPAVTGAALGMAAGAWSATMAHLRCPHAGVVHGLVAHVAPTLVLVAVGALVGYRLVRFRR